MTSFKKTCLTCLNKKSRIYHDLHEILVDSCTVFQMLCKTMPMLFDSPNIPLPKIMCQKCSEKLLVSYKFQEQCSNALQSLHKLGNEPNIIIKEEILMETNESFVTDNTDEEVEDLKPGLEYNEKFEKLEKTEDQCYSNDDSFKNYTTKVKDIKRCESYEEKLNNSDKVDDNSDTDEDHSITSSRYEKSYSCTVCHKIFRTHSLLQSHLGQNHSFNNAFECRYCEYRFKTRPQLFKHEKLHNENEPKRECSLPCKECLKAFRQPYDLVNHIKQQHGGKALYECSMCPDTFEVEEQYKQHCNTHLGLKYYQCPQCPKGFDVKGCLNQHIISHKNDTTFLCTICGKAFKTSDGLKIHMQRHADLKPFKCSYCDRSFKCAADRYNHAMRHSTEKLYECKICGLHFRRTDLLSLHTNTHTGRKPYKCDFCGKSFAGSSNLKTHRRIHTGEKPYECQYCNKTFAQSSDRKKHIRRMHKTEQPPQVSKINEEAEVGVEVEVE